ncbi:MAG: zinc ribbon domain-containing protein [Peptococcaceae bacterium]|nr:zinc ribbon domain-containing protein [Peptococcaceae bacterium]
MLCPNCGKDVSKGSAFCNGCGKAVTASVEPPTTQPAQKPLPLYQQPQQAVCPKCGGTHISFQAVNITMGTRNRGRGCLWTLGRWTLIFCTLGLWLLVGRSKGKSNTKIKSQTLAVCQSCGNRWVA